MINNKSLLPLITVFLISSAALAAAPPDNAPRTPILHLVTGSYAAGELAETTNPAVLRWHAAPFVAPFEFSLGAVNAIYWPPAKELPRPPGDYCFELAGGDVLFGSLVRLDEKEVALDLPRVGRLTAERAIVHRIYRWRDSADLIYLGPNGLSGWTDASLATLPGAPSRPIKGGPPPLPSLPGSARPAQAERPSWREESGQLVTDREGVSLRGDFGLSARASIEFEISWKTKPDFILALGVDATQASVKRAFRLEAWGGDLVIQREIESEADLAIVQELPPGAGRTHLQIFLDQEAGRLLAFSPGGKRLAVLKLNTPKPVVLPGLYLANVRGDLRLEWLRISRWSGQLPREARADQARIHHTDGSIVYGHVTEFDAASREFAFRDESHKSRIAQDRVASIFLSAPGEDRPRSLRVVYLDGTRLSGELKEVTGTELVLAVPGFKEALRLPRTALRSLLVLRHEDHAPATDGLAARLETDGVLLPGRLGDGRAHEAASCLVWQPAGSANSSALRQGVAGRIVYREPPPPQPRQPRVQGRELMGMNVVMNARMRRQQPQGLGQMVMRFAEALNERPAAEPAGERRSLYLRDGDVIPSVITRIDERGVYFKTSLSKSAFVSHVKVKAIELAEAASPLPVRLTRSKRERLLTLPRMQKPDPPTHLIRSRNGDYLRGRLIEMDDKALQVELRLETKEVARSRIAQIIWLHKDEFDSSKKTAEEPAANAATRVQALRNDGVRLTFWANRIHDGIIAGTSEVLGPCNVAVNQVDQFYIGGAIEKAASQLAYQQWKLQSAPEPKYMQSEGAGGVGGDGTPGTESPLVGRPAPDFELDLLGGKKFHLAASKGKVVVLDFWATWCGPCIQAMPQVEAATREVENQGVQLVAVNLQETPEQITSMLQRHKMKLSVALDKEGLVADKYNAVAIPQTVIVNRDGTVARLFVGGGPHFLDQLRAALKAVLDGPKPAAAAEKSHEPAQR
jgi:thiol-disulfide isomerase/thioredoxin